MLLWNLDEAARQLGGVSPRTVRRLIERGDLAAAPCIIIAEGYATAATLHEVTGHCAVMAVDAGNLRPVAEALRALYPSTRLVVAADNDRHTEGNPGVKKATAAAEVFKAGMAAINPAPVPAKPAQGTVLRLASNADQDGLMQEVDALVAQGLGYAAICREFNAAGRTTAKGAQFRSSDLARAHQRWKTRSAEPAD